VSYHSRQVGDSAHSGGRILARPGAGRASAGRGRAGVLGVAAGAGGLIAASVAGVVEAPAARAGAVLPCVTRTVSTPFSAWGDTNPYFTLPGGAFEDGAPGWALYGSAVVPGNEPWKVLSRGDSASLKISGRGLAQAPAICIATAEDALRFFYRAPGVPASHLKIMIHVTSGTKAADGAYDLAGAANGWRVSDRIMLPDVRDASGQQALTITFAQGGAPASWSVDDVEIDPWRSL
jgi:hypothetical protein